MICSLPSPSAASQTHLAESLYESLWRTEILGQRLCQPGRDFLFEGSERLEEEAVVPRLGGVVEDAALGGPDDFLDGHVFILGVDYQFVQVVHISLQMFSVVEFECFPAHVRGQRFQCVGKLGNWMGHVGGGLGVKE